MMNVLLVGLGGFFGAISRYGTGVALTKWFDPVKFPAATFAVNLLGCFLIGLAFGLGDNTGGLKREIQLFVCIGFLGGFTTFSAFGNETVALIRTGRLGLALIYVAASVIAGVTLVWMGYLVAGMMGAKR